MTSEVIIGGVFALLGALVGVVAGVIGERYARRVGGVHSAISGWDLERKEDGKATYVLTSRCSTRWTSTRGPGTSTWCSSVEVGEITNVPRDSEDGSRTDALNFQSRTWLTKDLRGEIEDARRLGDEYSVELRGALHTGAEIRQEIRPDGGPTTKRFKENGWL